MSDPTRLVTSRERALAIVLRIGAVPLLLALPCAALPFSWMDATHRWLGLGPLPQAPIVIYLARSCSLFYGFHGLVMVFLSFDVRRYLPFIQFFCWLGAGFGIAMLAVDRSAELPAYWRQVEGPLVVVYSLVILWIARRARIPEGCD